MFARNFSASNVGAIGGGVAGAAMPSDKPGKVIGCAKEDLLGGYVSNEIPLRESPIVTVIGLDIDGRVPLPVDQRYPEGRAPILQTLKNQGDKK